MRLPNPPAPLRRVALVVAAIVAVVWSCDRSPTEPSVGSPHFARIALAPAFDFAPGLLAADVSNVVPFDHVHIVLHHGDGTIALDTTVDFPPGADSLTLSLLVPLSPAAPPTGEPLALNLDYVNAAGVVVFSGGPIPVTAAPAGAGAPAAPVNVPVHYTGTGSNATKVVITPPSLAVNTGGAFTFTAQAFDASGTPVPGTPIVFASADASVATITAPGAGAGVAGTRRGTTRITAQLLTGASDAATLIVQPVASAIAPTSGNGQTGAAGTALGQPVVVKVTASDGLPFTGATVTFAAQNGGSVASSSVATDNDGLASTSWQLGPTTIGPQTVTATAVGLTGSPVTFTATAQAGSATKLVVTAQPVSALAGGTLTSGTLGPVTVTAQDVNGNTATAFSGTVAFAIANNPGGATLGGTASAPAVAGVATFSSLSLDRPGTGYTLAASSGSLTPATTTPFDIAPNAPAVLAFTTQPSNATAGAAIAPPVVLTLRDAVGNVATTFAGSVVVQLAPNVLGATLGGTTAVTAVAGVATFSNLTVNRPGTGYQLLAGSSGVGSAVSSQFNVVVGAPAACTITQGSGVTLAGGTANTVTVLVTDGAGNAIPGVGVTAVVASGGGSVAPASANTDALGQATMVWTLGVGAGPQTLSVTCGSLAPVIVPVTATPSSGATQVAFSTPPSNVVAGTSIAPSIVVQARNALGAVDTTYAGTVTLAFGANPGAATLGGTLSVAAVAGVASFNNISITKAANAYTLVASSGALAPATSVTFNVNAAAAANIVADSGNAQLGTTGSSLPTQIVARVSDAFGNPVSGFNVTLAVVTGGGSTAPSGVVATDVNGRVRTTWTLGALIGAQTMTASAAGLAGSPITFAATAGVSIANLTWTGATSTSWTVATNWSPAVVPVASDSVFIPVTTNQPVLAAPVTLKALYLSPTATLSTGGNALTITGTLDAATTIIGGGSVDLTGTGTVKGVFSANLIVDGTYTINGATTVTGNVTVNGALTLGGNQFGITGTFGTAGTGALTMTSAADSLGVGGNVAFAGGSETGKLTAGVITVGGNFVQGGATTTAFVGAAAHTVRFVGAANQTITFSAPDTALAPAAITTCAKSCFGTLQIQKTTGKVSFASSAKAVSNFTVVANSDSVSAFLQRVIVGGALTPTASGSHFGLLAVNGAAPITAGFNADTTVYSGTNGVIGVIGNFELRVLGVDTLSGNVTVPGNVVAAGAGRLVFRGRTITINGNLSTAGTATIHQNPLTLADSTADSVVVGGNVSFAGGTSAPMGGNLIVLGNLTTTGAAFQAGGYHTTWFAGVSGGTQTITGSSPVAGQGLHHVMFANAEAKDVAGDITFSGNLQLLPTTPAVTGAGATVHVGGNIDDFTALPDTLGGWRVANSEMFGADTLAADFFSTNLTVTGVVEIPPSLDIPSFGGARQSAVRSKLLGQFFVQVNGNVVVTGAGARLNMNGNSFFVAGNFSTVNGGTLRMASFLDFLQVNGSATFGGGSTAGLLTNGFMNVLGNFAVTGGAPDAFSADQTFETGIGIDGNSFLRAGGLRAPQDAKSAKYAALLAKDENIRQQRIATVNARIQAGLAPKLRVLAARGVRPDTTPVAFRANAKVAMRAGPLIGRLVTPATVNMPTAGSGAGTSHFGTFFIQTNLLQLQSDLVVLGPLENSSINTVQGNNNLLTSEGASMFNVTFDNVRWKLIDGSFIEIYDNTTFQNMDPTVDQFTMDRPGPVPQLFQWTFLTTPTTGHYINANDSDGISPDVLSLLLLIPTPATVSPTQTVATNGATITWGSLLTWVGGSAGGPTDWNQASNWLPAAVPTTNDDVLIPAAATSSPVLSTNAFVHNLTVQAGKSVDLGGDLLLSVEGDITTDVASPGIVNCIDGALVLEANTGVHNVVGNMCSTTILGNYKISGTGNSLTVDLLSVGPTGNLTVNGATLNVGTLATFGSATLTMTNPADVVNVSSGAFFNGGSTAGLLTAGKIVLTDASLFAGGGAADGFAPSGTHKTVFKEVDVGAFVSFNDPTQSFFQELDVDGGVTLSLGSNATVNGTLTRTGTGAVTIQTVPSLPPFLLTTSGLNQTAADQMTFSNAMLKFVDGTANATFQNVVFSSYLTPFTGSVLEVARSTATTIASPDFRLVGFAPSVTAHLLNNSGSGTVTFVSPQPTGGVLGTAYIITGTGVVVWP